MTSSSLQAARPPCSTLCGIRQAPPPCVKGPSMTHFFLEDHPFFSSPLLCLSRRRTVPTPAALSRVPPRPSVPKSRVPESRPPLCPETRPTPAVPTPETRQLPESRLPPRSSVPKPRVPESRPPLCPETRQLPTPETRQVPESRLAPRCPESRRAQVPCTGVPTPALSRVPVTSAGDVSTENHQSR